MSRRSSRLRQGEQNCKDSDPAARHGKKRGVVGFPSRPTPRAPSAGAGGEGKEGPGFGDVVGKGRQNQATRSCSKTSSNGGCPTDISWRGRATGSSSCAPSLNTSAPLRSFLARRCGGRRHQAATTSEARILRRSAGEAGAARAATGRSPSSHGAATPREGSWASDFFPS